MAENAVTPLTGQCLCGSIQYEVDRIEPNMGHCHCSMCRKFHGAAFATFGEALKENFRWIKGEALLVNYDAENGTRRQFCRKCGSSLTFAPTVGEQKVVEFSLGTLDSPIEQKPDANIFVAFKANWFDIDSGLPSFHSGRDSKRVS